MHLIDLIAMGLLRRPAVADLLTQHAAKAVADRTAEDARLRWQAQNLDKLDPAANVAGNPYLAGQGIAAPSAVVTKLAPTTPSMLDGLVSDIDSWTRDGRPRLTDGEGSGCAD